MTGQVYQYNEVGAISKKGVRTVQYGASEMLSTESTSVRIRSPNHLLFEVNSYKEDQNQPNETANHGNLRIQ